MKSDKTFERETVTVVRVSRRQFLKQSLGVGGVAMLRCGGDSGGNGAPCANPFASGKRLADIPFFDESGANLNTAMGAGLKGRLFTDLSTLTPETLVTPNENFYIRTRASDLLDTTSPWNIQVDGLVENDITLTLESLATAVKPMPTTLLECSGNSDGASFGLISAANWSGIALADVLASVKPQPSATRVLVAGFDQYSTPPGSSVVGASWIFTLDEIAQHGAFLATEMNGVPLPLDHGFPVRLIMPGWYGCTCIKWVNQLTLLDESALSTEHMREFAGRTHQDGTPKLARDFLSASMDQAAMPVRVEKWRLDGAIAYNVVGISWGGYEVTDKLAIRFGKGEPYVPVDICPDPTTNRTWSLWSYAWTPAAPGVYSIHLIVDDPDIPTRRLDTGYYIRSVAIDEV